jgi:anti-sigma factor RsiW
VTTHARRGPGCRALLEQLFKYIDAELSPSRVKVLENHLRQCSCCGRLERELRRSVAACRDAGQARLPRDVRLRAQRRVRALLRATEGGGRRPPR